MPTFRDFSGRNVLPVVRFERPDTLNALRDAILRAEAEGLSVHAMGTAWAFSAPAYCEGVIIDTSGLAHFPTWGPRVIVQPERGMQVLAAVEAGIKVHDLDLALMGETRRDHGPPFPDRNGRILVLPTHGGAGGQSIAGAFSTGTHGGDAARPPLGDYVRAMVLVGSGGIIRLVQRPDDIVVEYDRFEREIRPLVAADAIIIDERSADAFDAAILAVGRFGVIYAYIVELHDETNVRVVELRTKTTWSQVRPRLESGELVRNAVAADEFLQIVVNPVAERTGERACYVTRHKTVPAADVPARAGDAFGEPGRPSDDVREARSSIIPEWIGQALCVDHMTHELEAARLALQLIAAAMALNPLTFPFGALVAVPLLEAAASINRIGPDHRLGDVLADLLNFATRSGHPDILSGINKAVLDGAQSPHFVHGTRPDICDFFDYENDCYRADSIEIFVAADNRLPLVIEDVVDVFNVMTARGTPIGAYISARILAPSRALLGLTPGSASCAIEISMLRGLLGNSEALD